MPNGNYYVGKGGFQYKRMGGGGNHRNFPLGLITGVYADVNTKYVPGAGVGASSISYLYYKLYNMSNCSSSATYANNNISKILYYII